MAYYEYFAERDIPFDGRQINKGEKVEVVTKGNLKPTSQDLIAALKKKYGEKAMSVLPIFKLADKK